MEALQRAKAPASAYMLLEQLREHGLRAPLQVYRALAKLVDEGMVHRLDSLNAFVACAHPHDGAHDHGRLVFAICKQCGTVEEFADGAIGKRLTSWAAEHAFKIEETTLEVRGLCVRCRAA
jgi:Fur family zinc uptake transcriptional regulator